MLLDATFLAHPCTLGAIQEPCSNVFILSWNQTVHTKSHKSNQINTELCHALPCSASQSQQSSCGCCAMLRLRYGCSALVSLVPPGATRGEGCECASCRCRTMPWVRMPNESRCRTSESFYLEKKRWANEAYMHIIAYLYAYLYVSKPKLVYRYAGKEAHGTLCEASQCVVR